MGNTATEAVRKAAAGLTDDELAEIERQLDKNKANKERDVYLATSAGSHLQEFVDGISDSVNTEPTPTGFEALDEALDGGFYPGLHIMSGISSVGKTSFVLQMVDQIAQAGGQVLYFSLEMSRGEMMAKSISRHTLTLAMERHLPTAYAKTSRGITCGKRYEHYTPEETQLIKDSVDAYGTYANNIFYDEGDMSATLDHIAATIEKHIRLTRQKPFVVVDYLQLVQPADAKYSSDRANMDSVVHGLRYISRQYMIPILCISSYSRTYYRQEAQLASAKESGGIEYTADVVLALQPQGVGKDGYDEAEAKAKNPRAVELCILKNRYGQVNIKLLMSYYTLFGHFRMEAKPKGKQW